MLSSAQFWMRRASRTFCLWRLMRPSDQGLLLAPSFLPTLHILSGRRTFHVSITDSLKYCMLVILFKDLFSFLFQDDQANGIMPNFKLYQWHNELCACLLIRSASTESHFHLSQDVIIPTYLVLIEIEIRWNLPNFK